MRSPTSMRTFSPPWLDRDVLAIRWWELEQFLNRILGLDPYGEEPDGRRDGRRAGIRWALLHVSWDPMVVSHWLALDGGEQQVLSLARQSRPLTRKTFDAYPPSRVMRRLHLLLDQCGALAPTEEEREKELAQPLTTLLTKRVSTCVKASLACLETEHSQRQMLALARQRGGRR